MTTTAQALALPPKPPATPAPGAVATLVRRRLQLTVRTPRELCIPLLTPILFALLIAPALREALHTAPATSPTWRSGVGLLIPLDAMFLRAERDRRS
jgi:hypothetical protein